MTIAEALIAEFAHEAVPTRRSLERIPASSLDWQPHPKSMGMRALACHIAEMPAWTKTTMETTELDFAAVDFKPFVGETVASIVARYDESLRIAVEALEGHPDSDFMVPWTLRKGDLVIFTLPRLACLRTMILNHQVHHRAQLGVYLRLNNVPVPSIYGPSADEA